MKRTDRQRGALLIISALILAIQSGCGDTGSGEENECDVDFVLQSEDQELGLKDPSLHDGDSLAQSFSIPTSNEAPDPPGSRSISQIQLSLSRVGTFDSEDSVTLSVFPDATGAPASGETAVGTSDVNVGVITNSPSFITFEFSPALKLNEEVTYWLHLSSTYPQSSEDFVKWTGHKGSTNSYEDGSALYELSTSEWKNTSIGAFYDLNFRVGCE